MGAPGFCSCPVHTHLAGMLAASALPSMLSALSHITSHLRNLTTQMLRRNRWVGAEAIITDEGDITTSKAYQ